MTVIIISKFFHYLSLFLAGGLGVANAMPFKNHQNTGTTPAPPVRIKMIAAIEWVTASGNFRHALATYHGDIAFTHR